MSELSTVNNQIARTVEVIASEIVGIKEAARKTLQSIATSAAVEIGKRLKEAKALVPYGEWGEWLRANVDYSERTAQNLLKLAEESNRGSFEALMDLSYTQAVQLIGLPEGRLTLAHAVVACATAPKSNAVPTAIGAALE